MSNFSPVAEVDQYFQCGYQIEEGQFLNVFQYDLRDGYEHELQPVPWVTMGMENCIAPEVMCRFCGTRILLSQTGR